MLIDGDDVKRTNQNTIHYSRENCHLPGVIRYCTNGEEFRRCLRELPPKSCGFCSNPFAYSASSIPILVLLLKGKNVRAFSCQIWSTSKVFMFKTIQARPVDRVRTVQGQLSQFVIRDLK